MRGATHIRAHPTGWLVVDLDGRALQTEYANTVRDVVFTNQVDADHVARAINRAYWQGEQDAKRQIRDLLNVPERKEGED